MPFRLPTPEGIRAREGPWRRPRREAWYAGRWASRTLSWIDLRSYLPAAPIRAGRSISLLSAPGVRSARTNASAARRGAFDLLSRSFMRRTSLAVTSLTRPNSSFAWIVSAALIQELRTGDNRLHQAVEAVAVFRKPRPHLFDGHLIRKRQAAP